MEPHKRRRYRYNDTFFRRAAPSAYQDTDEVQEEQDFWTDRSLFALDVMSVPQPVRRTLADALSTPQRAMPVNHLNQVSDQSMYRLLPNLSDSDASQLSTPQNWKNGSSQTTDNIMILLIFRSILQQTGCRMFFLKHPCTCH